MYLCMDSVKFLLEVPDASILLGALLSCDNVQTYLGVLLLHRALLIGTLGYITKLRQF